MDQDTSEDNQQLPQDSEEQQDAAPLRQSAEPIQQDSEDVQQLVTEFPQMKPRTEAHSIVVRVAVRMFEDAGVARSPRTIINLCNPNTKGESRLDCWQDQNDRTYYITQESIDRVIKEEQTGGRGGNLPQPIYMYKEEARQPAEPTAKTAEPVQQVAENSGDLRQPESDQSAELRQLRRETFELENTIKGKDIVIDQLQQVWDKMAQRLETQSELLGALKFENLQLKSLPAPRQNRPDDYQRTVDSGEAEVRDADAEPEQENHG